MRRERDMLRVFDRPLDVGKTLERTAIYPIGPHHYAVRNDATSAHDVWRDARAPGGARLVRSFGDGSITASTGAPWGFVYHPSEDNTTVDYFTIELIEGGGGDSPALQWKPPGGRPLMMRDESVTEPLVLFLVAQPT
jgi:hypothetical protein